MIKLLSLKGFKSFSEIDIPFKPLTLFSGLNNSGKSSIIQSLRMYVKACDNKSPFIEGYGSLRELRSKLSHPSEPVTIKLEYSSDDVDQLILHEDEDKQSYPEKSLVFSFLSADRLGPQTYLPLSNNYTHFPKIGDRGEFVYEFIDKLERSIVPDTMQHENSQGDILPLAIKGWLSEISPNVDFLYQLNSKVDIAQATFDEFRPKNVGFGLSHALPIISTILGHVATKPIHDWDEDWGKEWDERRLNNTLIVIENPETHLHPRGQTAMGVLLAMAASHGVQIVLETHSDHLMDGIRLACKEKLISNDDVIFHYLSKENSESETKIQTPSIDENGKLSFWPNGFFDQSMKIRAKLARK
ncbi:AAA family ATPase [Cognaticolwellia beringensis]|jgi:predicted ATPase|uniref:DUF3696 domain-containing protein n=1 Tax=Cognaticolwellia beringensis TaxID=1967665 RepID=A0A222G300_9GAMM|nr:DUF3696 domain-containing protein [Cognaticolwellia beringensis]ASP46308.1 DUF3696 domain-containing protein [Cognaticolwellia beringensis]ASP47391.1 DUF3696 domain-containing protein [Cognaticolwellia beringensis]